MYMVLSWTTTLCSIDVYKYRRRPADRVDMQGYRTAPRQLLDLLLASTARPSSKIMLSPRGHKFYFGLCHRSASRRRHTLSNLDFESGIPAPRTNARSSVVAGVDLEPEGVGIGCDKGVPAVGQE